MSEMSVERIDLAEQYPLLPVMVMVNESSQDQRSPKSAPLPNWSQLCSARSL